MSQSSPGGGTGSQSVSNNVLLVDDLSSLCQRDITIAVMASFTQPARPRRYLLFPTVAAEPTTRQHQSHNKSSEDSFRIFSTAGKERSN